MLHRNIKRDVRHKSAGLYSSHASDGFNIRLHGILRDFSRDMANALGDRLAGIVMGGSYGRGDALCVPVDTGLGSGVWSVGHAPRDDIHIVVILRFPQHGTRQRVQNVLNKYSQIIGVSINITQTLTLQSLANVPHQLQWYELAAAHQVIYGPEYLLETVRVNLGFTGETPGEVSFEFGEAGRLHQGSGLQALGALQVLYDPEGRVSDWRHLLSGFYPAILRLVDAILASCGQWEWNPRNRIKRLEEIVNQDSWFLEHTGVASQLVAYSREAVAYHASDFCQDEKVQEQCRASWFDFAYLWVSLHSYLEWRKPFVLLSPSYYCLLWLFSNIVTHPDQRPGWLWTKLGSLLLKYE